MTSDSAILDARDLWRRRPDGTGWLLQAASLRVDAGECLAVVGASGSGKTLLLRAAARLDPLDRGEVLWQGRPLTRDAIPEYRSQAVYLHQRPAFAAATVEEALRQPFALKTHRRRAFNRPRVERLLETLGRDGAFLSKQVRDVSGGESQIVALVRAMQLAPTLLMLDEPTAALDANTVAAAERLLREWIDEVPDRRAIVWVTHDAQQARRVAERTVQIDG